LLSFIANENPNILWFIWGSFAEKQTQNLPIKKLVSSHPMICCNKTKDFLFDINMFKQTKDLINWTGIQD
jgi:uracil DNA glycosylase